MRRKKQSEPARGEALVAIMNNKTDLRVLQEQGWYRIPQDKRRYNDLQSAGWRVLLFSGQQIRDTMAGYCALKIAAMVNELGGLSDEGLVSRAFYQTPDGLAQQLTLFEADEVYDLD